MKSECYIGAIQYITNEFNNVRMDACSEIAVQHICESTGRQVYSDIREQWGHFDRLVQFADSTTVAYLQDLRIWHSVCWDGGYVLCHSDKWWPFTLFADGNDENHDCLDVDDVRAGVCQCNQIIRGHNYSDEPANVIVRVVKLLKPGTPGSVIRLDVE